MPIGGQPLIQLRGDLTGYNTNASVERILGRRIKNDTPADSHVLVWNDDRKYYESREMSSVGGAILAIEAADGDPSFGTVNTIILDEADGFSLSQPSSGEIRIDLLNIPKSIISGTGTWDDGDIPSTVVRTSRTINTTSPLAGGGDLSSDLTLTLNTVPTTKGGTGLTSYTKGDILYSDASDSLAVLSGNITTTKQVLTQTGDGAASAAPTWEQLSHSDLANLSSDDHSIYLLVDGTRAMTGSLDMGSNKIVNLAEPTASTDATTKSYVDNIRPKLPDDGTTPPEGEGDGYTSVVFTDNEGRIYFFVEGIRFYVTATAAAADPLQGNPMGLLLSLTYANDQ